MNTATLAISGNTGALGGRVAALVDVESIPPRLLARDPLAPPRSPAAVPCAASMTTRESTVSALEGNEVLFIVFASGSANRLAEHVAFVITARRAGLSHIAYTSLQGAAADGPTRDLPG